MSLIAETYKRCLAQELREQISWFYKFADDKDMNVRILKDLYFVYLAELN